MRSILPNTTTTNYPFGMLMPGRTYSSAAYSWGFNGKEKDDEISGEGNNLDFGARIYDSRLGRWMSVDPLAGKYPSMSPYNCMGDNPIYYIDSDGREIVVPNKSDQKKILKMINSKAAGTYAFNSSNQLMRIKGCAQEKTSKYYAKQLDAAIKDSKKIEIVITPKYIKGYSVEKDGSITQNTGKVNIDLDKIGGGGATTNSKGTDQVVYITDNGLSKLEGADGKMYKKSAAEVLLHELVGHAIPNLKGTDTGNAVDNENRAREQTKDPLRKRDKKHVE